MIHQNRRCRQQRLGEDCTNRVGRNVYKSHTWREKKCISEWLDDGRTQHTHSCCFYYGHKPYCAILHKLCNFGFREFIPIVLISFYFHTTNASGMNNTFLIYLIESPYYFLSRFVCAVTLCLDINWNLLEMN